jgi:hypothetical protein
MISAPGEKHQTILQITTTKTHNPCNNNVLCMHTLFNASYVKHKFKLYGVLFI